MPSADLRSGSRLASWSGASAAQLAVADAQQAIDNALQSMCELAQALEFLRRAIESTKPEVGGPLWESWAIAPSQAQTS
jgi:hypothetical protein